MSKKRKTIVAAAAAGVMIFVSIYVIRGYLTYVVIYNPILFQAKKFDEIARWAQGHESATGLAIYLPERYRRFSITGRVYVSGDYILVPTWVGRHTILPIWITGDKECDGYLFVKDKLRLDEPAGDLDQVTIYTPNFSGLYGIDESKGSLERPMVVAAKKSPHWYTVETLPTSVLEDVSLGA
jgi:hypothetical protein